MKEQQKENFIKVNNLKHRFSNYYGGSLFESPEGDEYILRFDNWKEVYTFNKKVNGVWAPIN